MYLLLGALTVSNLEERQDEIRVYLYMSILLNLFEKRDKLIGSVLFMWGSENRLSLEYIKGKKRKREGEF